MGMFDSLKKRLKDFSEKAEEEVELEEVQPMSEEEMEAELAALEAEVSDEIQSETGETPGAHPVTEATKPATEFEAVEPLPDADTPTPAPAPEREPEPEPPATEEVPTPTEPEPTPTETEVAEPEPTPPPAPEPEVPTAPEPEVPSEPAREAAEPEPTPPPATPEMRPRERMPPLPKEGGKAINVERIEDLLWDLELSLLESDVAMDVVEQIQERLKAHLGEVRVKTSADVPKAVEAALRHAILDVLAMDVIDFDAWAFEKLVEKKPLVIMFVGVNGTGKTTAIGRIAHRLKENAVTTVMAAGDTFRAGAIQQLEQHGNRLGVTVVKTQPGGDPAAVAYDAIEHAKSRRKDIVLLDTAGRMQTNTNLMDEMKKIKRVANPDMIVFVGDSLAGNDAVDQARKFNEAVGLDSVILTKVDTDAKGGAALSIAHAVGKPILFLGVGQDYGDLVAYDPVWMVNRIFEESEIEA